MRRITSKKKQLTITIYPQGFYHINDEHALFEWIAKIKCVEKVVAYDLYIKSKRITLGDIENLIGIFKRYNFQNIEQLNVFRNKYNEKAFIGAADIPDTQINKSLVRKIKICVWNGVHYLL